MSTEKMKSLLSNELKDSIENSKHISDVIVTSFEDNYADKADFKRKFRSFLWNIRRSPSREFMIEQIKSGLNSEDHEWNIRRLYSIPSEDYNPEKKAKFEMMHKLASGKKNIETVPEGSYTCRRCRSKRIVTIQKQTRSADEPMTCFHTCVECDNRWKS